MTKHSRNTLSNFFEKKVSNDILLEIVNKAYFETSQAKRFRSYTKGKVQIKKCRSQVLGNKQPSTYELKGHFFDFAPLQQQLCKMFITLYQPNGI